MLIVDGHLDLALNALQGNRDLLVSAFETRTREFGTPGKGQAQGMVALPEMREGRVALSFVTVLGRCTGRPVPHIDFARVEQAHAAARGHLAYYRALERRGHVRLVTDRDTLDDHMASWERWEAGGASGPPPPLGFVILMESADPILEPDDVGQWHADGLRLIGPAHFGPGRYAGGTGVERGLSESGRRLLEAMARHGLALDLTHLSDASFWEALERFDGPVLASHSNARALVPNQRQFSDEQLRAIVGRGGVIGVLLGCSDLVPGWVVGSVHNGLVTLEHLVDHIEHLCDLAGDARHVAIGSDIDGGVGSDEFPRDLDTIVDLQRLPERLAARGFADGQIADVMHGNWLRFLREAWS
jgi:membrane dipeptidase